MYNSIIIFNLILILLFKKQRSNKCLMFLTSSIQYILNLKQLLFGKSYGLMDNPHAIQEGHQVKTSIDMYAVSRDITTTPIKTEFPGTIDVCPTAKTEGSGPDLKMKLVQEPSTIYANNKVLYETVISLPSTTFAPSLSPTKKVKKSKSTKHTKSKST